MTTPTRIPIALIGADGSGKSTVAEELRDRLGPSTTRYIYMGVSLSSSNRMLPTTRLLRSALAHRGLARREGGPPDHHRRDPEPATFPARVAKRVRRLVRFLVLVSEEWYRQGLTWWHLGRGRLVIHDRHFFIDYHAYDISAPRTVLQWLHGRMLLHLYPRPGLVVLLDAPADVLFARKGEGTIELLERRRQDYLALRSVLAYFERVDATQPVEAVVDEIVGLIERFDGRRVVDGSCGSVSGPAGP